MTKKIAVIGSGFAGMAVACKLAKAGCDVTVYEKNNTAGGRAREFTAEGFTFDMGPSWYWMPDVFESFFNVFGKSVSDYYTLERLDPSYRVVFSKNEQMDIPAELSGVYQLFERLEPGSSEKLKAFLDEAAYKYDVGINDLVYKPGQSLSELVDFRLMKGVFKLHVFQSIAKYIRKYFKDDRIIQLLEFPVLFLGAMPSKTPALYSLMNYADIALGTWYPKGGMNQIVQGMQALAESLGVKFKFDAEVDQIKVNGNSAEGIVINETTYQADYIVAGADYNHVEQNLLPAKYRKYSKEYWDSREMAPSSLIFYLGVNKKVNNILHHNLFFDQPFEQHAREIYEDPQWPSNPLFYVSATSKTDPNSAPEGMENVFILIPVAPGLADDDKTREKYYELVMNRLEELTGEKIKDHVIFKRSYAHNDFIKDY
ncbi:MAG: phytoene desaturase family protein [Bacteroidota bacterium]